MFTVDAPAAAALVATPNSASAGEFSFVSAPAVQVATVIAREITQWEEYTVRFKAVDDVQVQARVSGYLETVRFRRGQIVKAACLHP